MKKKKDAFTLLETLVVISLISVMVSLLLPALASAQATARLAPCQANLRQFLTASMSYAADFKEYVPGSASFENASSSGNPTRSANWHMSFSRPWHQAPAPIVINMQRGYLPKNKDIAWCPDRPRETSSSDHFWGRDIDDNFGGISGTGYGVNGHRWASKTNTPGDPYWQYRNGGAIFPVEWSTYHKAYYMTETAGVADILVAGWLDPSFEARQARHHNQLNVSFPDGRVEVFDYDELYTLLDIRDPEFCWGE